MSRSPHRRQPIYSWPRHRKLVLRVTPSLVRLRAGALAILLLQDLERRGYANVDVVETLYRTCSGLGRTKQAQHYRAKILRGRALRAARAKGMDRPIQNLLRALAGLESMAQTAPLEATARLGELMAAEDGLAAILDASEPVIEEHPRSLIVVYARAVALAKADRIEEASDLIRAQVEAVSASPATSDEDDRFKHVRLTRLTNTWRVVDAIARDKMAWASGGAEPEGDGADPVAGALTQKAPGNDAQPGAFEQEALLQGRAQARYLAACRKRFESEPRLREKLIAVRDMLRQGLRRLPAYHSAYTAARKAYGQVREQWTPMLADSDQIDPFLIGEDGGLKTGRLLIQVLQLARELGFDEDVAALEKSLLALAHDTRARTMLWTIASVLVDGDPDRFGTVTESLVEGAGPPTKPHEFRDFLAWAARARRHDLAHAAFAGAPESMRRSYSAIHYVKILQREGEFDRALQLVRTINSHVLAGPNAFCPFRHWGLIKRAAELEFLSESAHWYGSIRQPAKPKGIVMIAPRNAGQLTKYPMAVLMELKKRGWAVIPLVEGVLPVEPTGDPRIDQFIGCVLQDVRLAPERAASFKPIKGFSADIPTGRLRWGRMDLSQPLWEEGAINRRRYNVDFTCPSLQKFLGRLVEWTRLQGVVLQNAQEVFGELGLRVGTMAPMQARLPDAVVRFYCEQRGHPETFFCLHASNGYENYFANFSRAFSTKCGLRNVTAHPELRTASFPIPAEFEAWYQTLGGRSERMLLQVRDTTKVRRSTRVTPTPPPEGLACLDRVRAWKANGGKVACAFGKVVCDMAAPTDGGPAHKNLKDWLNHTIESVRGSRTLLLIKPHPHELRNEIATFLTEHLVDLIEVDIPDNVIVTGQDWFDIHELGEWLDLGLIYNGTTAVELGLMNIPAVLCADFAPTDYPIGHAVPRNRADYRRLVRFERAAVAAPDLPQRAAAWIHYMSGDLVTIPYRYHSRPLTNKVTTPPRWFREDIVRYLARGDLKVARLARRVTDLPDVLKPASGTGGPSTRRTSEPRTVRAKVSASPLPLA